MSKRKHDGTLEDTDLAAPIDVTRAESGTTYADATTGDASVTAGGVLVPTGADVNAAEQQLGQEAPRAAPKAGEGENVAPREVAHPELEPPPPPTEYRVAPAAPDQIERENFSGRPSLQDIEKAERVLVQTVDERSAGIVVGGVVVTPQPQEVLVQTLLNRTRQHLMAIATDPRIQVKIA